MLNARTLEGRARAETVDRKPGDRQPRRAVELTGFGLLEDGKTFPVTVLDLSYDGCSLATEQALVRGAKLRISIVGLGGAVEAAVRWVKNGRAGLQFDPDPEPAVQQIARTYERLKISTQVALRRVGRQHYHARLFNLTPVGCKVEFVERPKPGESLWVKFDSLEAVESTVRWVDGYYGGLQFVRPIYPAVFELLLKRLGA